jgi:hypothetical protein
MMDPNAAPLDVLQRSRLRSLVMGGCAFGCFCVALSFRYFSGMSFVFIAIALFIIVYFLFLEVQAIELFPAHLLLKYPLRKRRIERVDIDFVSMEIRTSTTRGVTSTQRFVRLKLRSGRKIDLAGFQIDIDRAYQKLKVYESTNEEFLRDR